MAQQGIKLLTSWTTAVKELVNCLSIIIMYLSIKWILFVHIVIHASINLKCLSIEFNVYPYVFSTHGS